MVWLFFIIVGIVLGLVLLERCFYNVDLIDIFTRSAPKVKFKTATNDDFEISSDDPSSAMRLTNLSVIKQRLPFCIHSSLQLANAKLDFNLLRCPYCRGVLNEGVKIVRCNSCFTMFHESCWIENRECAIFRCYGSTSEAIEVKKTIMFCNFDAKYLPNQKSKISI